MAEQSQHDRDLKQALQQIEKELGKGAIMRLGEHSVADVPGIPSGSLSLDIALGGKGFPAGRVVEIFGPESSGKTTVALHAVANAQKAGGVAAYIDAEHALDPGWAKRLGVDLEGLLVSQPSSGEEALKIAEMLIKSNAVDMIVIDSVAALVPKAEVEGEIGDSHMGLQARMMSQALRMLNPTIARTKTCMVFINQMRKKIGVVYGSPDTTPGGEALKYYSSVRLEIKKINLIKEPGGEEPIGARVKARVLKNKVAPPFRTAEFDLMHDSGISKEGDVLDLGTEDKLIQTSGSWITYGEHRWQGREKAKAALRENPALVEEISRKILESRGLVPPGAPITNGEAHEPAVKEKDKDKEKETPTRGRRQSANAD
jgi:recombination protein RecA